jgi:hypothetical protein
VFTSDDEEQLSWNKEALKLFSKLIDYRINKVNEVLTDMSASDLDIRSAQRTINVLMDIRNTSKRLYLRKWK